MGSTDWSGYVRELPGKRRLDTSRLFADAKMYRLVLERLAEPFVTTGVTKVAGLDALGFALAGGIAHILGVGVVHVRKGGKAMWHAETTVFTDYSGTEKTFELVTDAVDRNDTVLIVDDWSETGTSCGPPSNSSNASRAASSALRSCTWTNMYASIHSFRSIASIT